MLAACWTDEAAREALAATWRDRGAVRVPGVLDEAEAARFMMALRGTEHALDASLDGDAASYQLWRFGWEPGEGCNHTLCVLGRWLWGPGRAWVSALTGRALEAPDDRRLMSDAVRKGSFFDAYDDSGAERAVGFQLHLVPASWPASWGGHLDRLAVPAGTPVDAWAPAWNVLDLFDLGAGAPTWRRQAVLTRHAEGAVVSGWYRAGGDA